MYNLLRKDILVQKHTLWFALAYSIFIFFAFSKNTFSPFIYVMGSVAVSYILILSAVQSEYKNNSDIVLLSLPIKRREVVLSKYLAVLVYILLSLAAVGIIGLIFKLSPLPFPTRLINWQDAIITLVSVVIMISIYLPVYYKIDGKWLQVINIVLFMVFFFAPGNIMNYLNTHREEQWVHWLLQTAGHNPHMASLLGIALVGALMLVSYSLSVHIYSNQDF